MENDEEIESITYGRSMRTDLRDFICQLRIYTNKRLIGSFSETSCSNQSHKVLIPSSGSLYDFFNDNIKTRANNGKRVFYGFFNEFAQGITILLFF